MLDLGGSNTLDQAQAIGEYYNTGAVNAVLADVNRNYTVKAEGTYTFADGQCVWLVVITPCILSRADREALINGRKSKKRTIQIATEDSPVGQRFLAGNRSEKQ